MSVALFGVGGGVWGFSLGTGESWGGWGIILGGQRWVENIFGWAEVGRKYFWVGGEVGVGALFDNAQGFHLRE